ncbi:oxidoreductase [Paenibacillus guangzhouensis]|uniref:oxidoreductase n=1 Tax=Paenibacillus guangzhouensis TaxID=1473112 RepID=UPI001266E497|nr:oxidoreductase [Paenibacillus guangzhouensis]
MGNKTALVLGASGLVGKALVEILASRDYYQQIYLLVRRPLQLTSERCVQHIIDMDQLQRHQHLFDVNDVFCCLGTTIKKAKTREAFRKVDYDYPVEAGRLAESQHVDGYYIVTAMGANAASSIFYSRVKGEVEDKLAALGLPALHIFRPSLLTGDREEYRFGERVAERISPFVNPLLLGPLRKYRSIEAQTVALAMALTAEKREKGTHVHLSHEMADQVAYDNEQLRGGK